MRAAGLALGLAVVLGFGSCDGDGEDSARIVLEPVQAVTGNELDRAVEVMRARLDRLGIDEAEVERSGQTVIVRLPPSKVASAVPVLTRPGRFELFDLQGNLVGPSLDDNGFVYPLSSRPRLRAKTVVVTCSQRSSYCPGLRDRPRRPYYYLLRYDPKNRGYPVPELTAADILLEETSVKFDPNMGEPAVLIEFTDRGAEKFEEVTRAMAERGQTFHYDVGGPDEFAFQQLAIVIDGEIKSAPVIDYRENPAGIPGDNGAQIAGIGDLKEARELALVLQSGELPVRFERSAGSD